MLIWPRKINKLGLKMTDQRRTIVKVLAESNDHPDVELVYQRVVKIDRKKYNVIE